MEAVLDILHRGCYTSRLTLDHPVRIHVLSGHRTDHGSVGLWEMTGADDAALEAALVDLRQHPHMVRAEVVSRQPGRWVLETVDREAGVSTTLVAAGLVFLPPVVIAEGRERYRVFAVDRRQIETAVAALTPANEVAVLSLHDHVATLSPISMLTPRQRQVVEAAHRLGYYDRPRRAHQAAVARAVGLSRPTVAEHLALAEQRILDQVLGAPPRPGAKR